MTSLQGVIGREYALRSGERQAVADSIGEQYRVVPGTGSGVALALADRLDSLVALFAVGLAPTGAKDPFGMRRAALGIVEPLLARDADFDLGAAIEKAARLQPLAVDAKRRAEVLDFIGVRLAVKLKDAGSRYDVVDAVLAEQAANPAAAARSVGQLEAWVGRDDWKTTLAAFSRCVRITRDQKRTFSVAVKGLVEAPEKALYRELRRAEAALAKAPRRDPDSLLQAFMPMIPAVDAFFEEVLVMDRKKAVRENRLALLQRVAALAQGIADLSRLEGF